MSAEGRIHPSNGRDPPTRFRKGKLWIAAFAVVAALLAAGLVWLGTIGDQHRADAAASPSFAGSAACAECHRAETKLWEGSQHKHAMQHANSATILGDFNDASFEYYGVRSRFFKKD